VHYTYEERFLKPFTSIEGSNSEKISEFIPHENRRRQNIFPQGKPVFQGEATEKFSFTFKSIKAIFNDRPGVFKEMNTLLKILLMFIINI
jgi:hypothetical protein